MTYDLCRLRLNGLIRRIEHTHTYVLTPDGQRLAIFYTKPYNRLLRSLAAADQPQAPPALRQALTVIDHHGTTSSERDSSLRLENMTPLFRIPDPKLLLIYRGLPHSRRRHAVRWSDRDEPLTTRMKLVH